MKTKPKTTAELLQAILAIEQDTKSKETTGGLYLYTAAARLKLDKLRRAVAHNSAVKRKAEGNPVPADGYSGRQTNRR